VETRAALTIPFTSAIDNTAVYRHTRLTDMAAVANLPEGCPEVATDNEQCASFSVRFQNSPAAVGLESCRTSTGSIPTPAVVVIAVSCPVHCLSPLLVGFVRLFGSPCDRFCLGRELRNWQHLDACQPQLRAEGSAGIECRTGLRDGAACAITTLGAQRKSQVPMPSIEAHT
jgi:hypothetical protein